MSNGPAGAAIAVGAFVRERFAFLAAAQRKPRPTSGSFRVREVERGYANNAPHYNREPGFLVVAVEKVFSFRDDWHQDEHALPVVQQYFIALDSALASHPELHRCVVRCAHCEIRFLTYPQNEDRRDLRCPFGCRDHHRRECANRRSAVYYRSAKGQANRERNGSRSGCDGTGECQQQDVPRQEPSAATPPVGGRSVEPPRVDALPVALPLRVEGVVLDESGVTNSPMLPYVRMVIRVLEGIRLTCQEVAELLRQMLRRRSIDDRRRIDRILSFLHQHPPPGESNG